MVKLYSHLLHHCVHAAGTRPDCAPSPTPSYHGGAKLEQSTLLPGQNWQPEPRAGHTPSMKATPRSHLVRFQLRCGDKVFESMDVSYLTECGLDTSNPKRTGTPALLEKPQENSASVAWFSFRKVSARRGLGTTGLFRS